jgi:phospholipid transport system substrate-binding protein
MMFRYCLIGLISIFGFAVQGSPLNISEKINSDPLQIVESQTITLLDALSSRKAEFDNDQQSFISFARHVALKHWDLRKTSSLMLGKYWKAADKDQRTRFEEEFLATLLRYIVKAYGFYDESLVDVLSYEWQSKGKGGWVRSIVRLPAGLKLAVDYRMYQNKQKHWKLIDVRVEGISLVSSKRTEYREIIRTKGLENLIKSMLAKNQIIHHN